MASFYELTPDEVEWLIEVLEFWRTEGPPRTDDEILDYPDLLYYFEHGHRRGE